MHIPETSAQITNSNVVCRLVWEWGVSQRALLSGLLPIETSGIVRSCQKDVMYSSMQRKGPEKPQDTNAYGIEVSAAETRA